MSDTENTSNKTAETKETRRSGSIDMEAQTVKISDATSEIVLGLANYPNQIVGYLALTGLHFLALRSPDVMAFNAALIDGITEIPRSPRGRARSSPWREAAAVALVAHRKKSPEPITIDKARQMAMSMSPKELEKYKRRPEVVKAFEKLTGEVLMPSFDDLFPTTDPVDIAEAA